MIDDLPLQTLATKVADRSQKTLADRLLGYYRSHAPKSCDILIGTQIFNAPHPTKLSETLGSKGQYKPSMV